MSLMRIDRSFIAATVGLGAAFAAFHASAADFAQPAPVQFDGRYYQVVIA